MKTEVLAVIGEEGLSRPAAVNAALAANDRIKFALTLLQIAAAHADQPEQPVPACSMSASPAESMIPRWIALAEAAHRIGSRYHIPGAARLLERIGADLREMAAPGHRCRQRGIRCPARGAAVHRARRANDMLDATAIAALTRAGEAATDSLHQLVMDLHRALNAQQAKLAEENVDGALTYGLNPEDRPRVAAFMAGLNRTGQLKFNHPGLGTTASRRGTTLVIQNDIGADRCARDRGACRRPYC